MCAKYVTGLIREKCYLSPVLDMYNGEIVSYTISEYPDLRMVTDMLREALRKKDGTGELMLHSDQGWHYQHALYRKILKQNGIIQSMSRKGNCMDNDVMENFFGIMKSELLYLQKGESMEQFTRELHRYIKYDNNDRIKLKINEALHNRIITYFSTTPFKSYIYSYLKAAT